MLLLLMVVVVRPTYLEIGGVLDEVSATVPLDRRRRVSNNTTVKSRHLALSTFDVLQ